MNSNIEISSRIATHLPNYANEALSILTNAGFEAWLVGGFLRDTILGRPSDDIDIATNAKPKQVEQVFDNADWHYAETGMQHGTITIIKPETKQSIEVTTYRKDGEYFDNRHPEKVNFVSSIKEDLARRDFTINAIAWNSAKGIYDPYEGISDINNKIIRTVGEPKHRFKEDALRILRTARFKSQLGFNVGRDTFIQAKRYKHTLNKISVERIRDELTKLLCGDYVYETLMKFNDVIVRVIPEMSPCIGFDQKSKYHCYDVYEHTAVTVQNMPVGKYFDEVGPKKSKYYDTIGRWAAFLHDIGKPDCFTRDDKGNGRFYGHDEKSRDIARKITKRLKMPKDMQNRISLLVRWHNNPTSPRKRSVRKMLRRIAAKHADNQEAMMFRLICDLRRADTRAHAPEYATNTQEIDEVELVFIDVIKNNQVFSIDGLHIDGHDLIKLGCEPGPKIDEVLNLCLDAVINEQISYHHKDLIEFAKKHI